MPPIANRRVQTSTISFKSNYPPGALVPGQRPDRALNSAQFAAAQSARSQATAQGLTGRALEVYVASAVMKVPN